MDILEEALDQQNFQVLQKLYLRKHYRSTMNRTKLATMGLGLGCISPEHQSISLL